MVLTYTPGRAEASVLPAPPPRPVSTASGLGSPGSALASKTFRIVEHNDRYTLVQGDGVMLMRQYQAPPPMVYRQIQTLLDLPSADTEFSPVVAAAAGVTFAVIRRDTAPRVITALAQEGVYPLTSFIERNLPAWQEAQAAAQQTSLAEKSGTAPRRAARLRG